MRKLRNVYQILIGNPEGKRPLGTPRHRLEDNFNTYLSETELKGVDQQLF
jgi:hypothetical protein